MGVGGNYPGGNCPDGAIFLEENCPRSIILGVIIQEVIIRGEIVLEPLNFHFFFIILKITQIFCLKIIKSNIKQIQSQLAVAMVILWFLWNYLKLTKSEWLLLDFILT